MTHHLQADCQVPGSAPEPYTLFNRVGLYPIPRPVPLVTRRGQQPKCFGLSVRERIFSFDTVQ